MQNNRKIAVLVSFSGEGGAERMVINLVTAFGAAGYQVDLLLVKARGAHLKSLPPEVNVVRLGAAHALTCLPGLVRYLREERPAALLAAKDRASRVALWARRFSGVDTRIAIRLGTTMSAALQGKGPLLRWLRYLPIRLFYHWADEIIVTCQGVANDLSQITHIPVAQIRVIPNPTVTPMIFQQAREPVAHPWFRDPNVPVILGAGRLTRQKDFPTLIRAFAHLRRQYVCRLVILGEGRRREDLEALASELGVKKHISMPGFVSNPHAFMARSALFVLSSAWEGLANVLAEALALGTPVVSTDCPNGPRELLQNGRYGRLVPVGDVDALAKAMLATLANPPDKVFLKHAVTDYTTEISSRRYLEVLLGQSA